VFASTLADSVGLAACADDVQLIGVIGVDPPIVAWVVVEVVDFHFIS
jgi:hypothetical protein